ncbi:MAG: lysophospholipid acyltransferase family protein [Dongiaceae bacterium]
MTGSLSLADTLDEARAAPRFTYASPELNKLGRGIVRLLEFASGQPRIRRLYEDHARLARPHELFWQDAIDALELDVRTDRDPRGAIPASGPLVVVANHPFGVLDGIILCRLVAQERGDFQIMTHRVLHQAPEVRAHILPVDFSGTDASTKNNLESRRKARELLDLGGALLVFPGGGVATATGALGPVVERPWGPLTAKLALAAGADVLPVYFHGQNSRLFHIASHIHQALRYGLLFHEVRNKIGRRIDVKIGGVIAYERLREFDDARAATAFLHGATHALAGSASIKV